MTNNKNVLKYGDYAVKVTLTHHYLRSDHCFRCDEDLSYWDDFDCDFWLYKSEKSAERKITELKSEYKISERDDEDDYDYYTVRKEVCLLWD